ncbi:MAG: hypothetical protein MHPSP_000409, partial [Paramarteilia canceri]
MEEYFVDGILLFNRLDPAKLLRKAKLLEESSIQHKMEKYFYYDPIYCTITSEVDHHIYEKTFLLINTRMKLYPRIGDVFAYHVRGFGISDLQISNEEIDNMFKAFVGMYLELRDSRWGNRIAKIAGSMPNLRVLILEITDISLEFSSNFLSEGLKSLKEKDKEIQE